MSNGCMVVWWLWYGGTDLGRAGKWKLCKVVTGGRIGDGDSTAVSQYTLVLNSGRRQL